MNRFCQSCAMPIQSDEQLGTNEDGTKNQDYCCYCYQNGAFTRDFSMDEMISYCAKFIVDFNRANNPDFSEEEAVAQMKTYFPNLKRWKNNEMPSGHSCHTCQMKVADYRSKAINCVKNTVLPIQMKQFQECNCNLDEQYRKYGNTEMFFANIIEPGHVYEMGYHRCVCPDVLAGKSTDPSHCECSKQSILYILNTLMPDKKITVDTIETVLSGAEKCRFKVSLE